MSKIPQKKPGVGRNGQPVPSNPNGRPKGALNKITRTAKENIEKVYGLLGDVKGHVAFLNKHPREKAKFYSDVYRALLPLDVKHSGDVGIGLRIIDQIVETKREG